jgi:hypothetical protein
MTIKQIMTVLSLIGLIVGGVWAVDKRYTPREVTKMQIAQVQQNQLQIQRNSKIQNAQNWLLFWTMKVSALQQECNAQPNNPNKRIELNEAMRQRDIWQREVNRLMGQ